MGIIQPCKSQQLFRLYPQYHLQQAPQQNPYDLTILSRDKTLYIIKQSDQPIIQDKSSKRILSIAGQQKIQDKVYTLFQWSNRTLQHLKQDRINLKRYLNPHQILFYLQQSVAAYAQLYNQELNNRSNPNKQLCIKFSNIKLFKNDKVVKILPPYVGNYKQNQFPDYRALGVSDISILALIFLDLGLLQHVRDIYSKPQRLQTYLQMFQKRYGAYITKVIKRMINGATWQQVDQTLNRGCHMSDMNSVWSGTSGNMMSGNFWRMPDRTINQTLTYYPNSEKQLVKEGGFFNSRKNIIEPQQNHKNNHFNKILQLDVPYKQAKSKQNSFFANSVTQFEKIERQKQKSEKQFKKSRCDSKKSMKGSSKKSSRIVQQPKKQLKLSKVSQKAKQQSVKSNQMHVQEQNQSRSRKISFTYKNRDLSPNNNVHHNLRDVSSNQNRNLSRIATHNGIFNRPFPVNSELRNGSYQRKVSHSPSYYPNSQIKQVVNQYYQNPPSIGHPMHRCQRSPSKILKINQDEQIIFQPSTKDTIILQPFQGVPKQGYTRKTKPDYEIEKKDEKNKEDDFVPSFIKQKQNNNPKKLSAFLQKYKKKQKEENPQKHNHGFNLKQVNGFQQLKTFTYQESSQSDSLQYSSNQTPSLHIFPAVSKGKIATKKNLFAERDIKSFKDLPQSTKNLLPDPNDCYNRYTGSYHPVNKRMRHGQGKMYFNDGKVYQGNWHQNMMQDYGVLYGKDGYQLYKGFWRHNKPNGQGKQFNDKITQKIKMNQNLNRNRLIQDMSLLRQHQLWQQYQGDFKNGLWEGNGKIRFINGDFFEGQFVQGRVNGYGIYMNKYGQKFQGKWQNDLLKH